MTIDEIEFCPLCRGVDEEVISQVLQIAKRETMDEGQQIYMQGDKFKGIYVILSGEVRLFSQNEEGKEFLVKRLGSKEVFGESGLHSQKYFENATAQSLVQCIFLPGTEFEKLLSENSHLSDVFFKLISIWLTDFYKRFQLLSYTSVAERVKQFLISESERTKSNVLNINLKRHEIASNLGVRPETLSRIVASLEKEKQIHIETNNKIVLLGLGK